MWVCVYCGKPVPNAWPHPSVFECCHEIGHVTEIDDEAEHEEHRNHMREVAREGT